MIAKNKRSLKNGYEYDSLIPKADFETQTLSNFITVDDTVSSIIKIVQKTQKDTEKLAQTLKRDTIDETCKAIFDFVYNHIQYVKDRTGYEELRRPARTWADKKGDCDCYSIFIGSILYNLKIPFSFRVTKYSGDWQHIYPIVYDKTSPKGYRIIDCVVDEYDYEVPYTEKQDTKMSTLYLSGFDTYTYDTETSIMEDLAGLGRAKKKAKAAKKAAGTRKKSSAKKAQRKTAKATKKAAKKQKKATKKATKKAGGKKFGGSKSGKRKASGITRGIKKGKEKRQAKRAARKEKKAANPRKKGLFAKARERKKDRREAKAAEKQKKNTQTSNPNIKINPSNEQTQSEAIERDDFKDDFVETPVITPIKQDDFADTSKDNPKEWMSEDGQDYNNQGSWGSDKQDKKDEFSASESKNDFAEKVTETGLQIREGAAMIESFANESEDMDSSESDEKGNSSVRLNDDEGETKGDNFLSKAVNYAKENPLIVGGGVVGTGIAIWGISKLTSSKPSPTPRTQRTPPRSVKPKAVNGLEGTKKKKGKSTLHSKAQRKHGRASFNGFN